VIPERRRVRHRTVEQNGDDIDDKLSGEQIDNISNTTTSCTSTSCDSLEYSSDSQVSLKIFLYGRVARQGF